MLDVSGDCGQPEVPPHTAGRIVNGEEATPHSFPWMVMITLTLSSGLCATNPEKGGLFQKGKTKMYEACTLKKNVSL